MKLLVFGYEHMWITSLATYYSIKWSQDNTESLSNCYMCITPTTSIWKLKWYTIKGVVWRKIDHWYVCIKTIFMRKFQHMVMQNTFLCSRVARIFWAEGTGGSQTFPGRTQLLNSLHLYRANIHSKIFHRGMGPWRGGGEGGLQRLCHSSWKRLDSKSGNVSKAKWL